MKQQKELFFSPVRRISETGRVRGGRCSYHDLPNDWEPLFLKKRKCLSNSRRRSTVASARGASDGGRCGIIGRGLSHSVPAGCILPARSKVVSSSCMGQTEQMDSKAGPFSTTASKALCILGRDTHVAVERRNWHFKVPYRNLHNFYFLSSHSCLRHRQQHKVSPDSRRSLRRP